MNDLPELPQEFQDDFEHAKAEAELERNPRRAPPTSSAFCRFAPWPGPVVNGITVGTISVDVKPTGTLSSVQANIGVSEAFSEFPAIYAAAVSR
jgi:hypothetical protein